MSSKLDQIKKIAAISLYGAITTTILVLGYQGTLTLRALRFSTLPAIQQAAQSLPVAAAATTATAQTVAQAGAEITATRKDIDQLVRPTQNLEATWSAAGLTAAQSLAKERDSFAAQQASYLALTDGGVKIETDVDAAVNSAAPGIKNFVNASAAADDLIADPANKQTLAHINTITDQAADGHTETTLLVGATRKAFAPQNKFLTVAKAMLGGTLTAAELVYYLSK
jgi:hypothetical protein